MKKAFYKFLCRYLIVQLIFQKIHGAPNQAADFRDVKDNNDLQKQGNSENAKASCAEEDMIQRKTDPADYYEDSVSDKSESKSQEEETDFENSPGSGTTERIWSREVEVKPIEESPMSIINEQTSMLTPDLEEVSPYGSTDANQLMNESEGSSLIIQDNSAVTAPSKNDEIQIVASTEIPGGGTINNNFSNVSPGSTAPYSTDADMIASLTSIPAEITFSNPTDQKELCIETSLPKEVELTDVETTSSVVEAITNEVPDTSNDVQTGLSESSKTQAVVEADIAVASKNVTVDTKDQGQYKTITNLAPQVPDPQRVPALENQHQVSDIPVEIAVLTTERPLLTSILAGTTLNKVTGVPDVTADAPENLMVSTLDQGQYETITNLAPQVSDPQRVPALESEHQVPDIPVDFPDPLENRIVYTTDQGQYKTITNLAPQVPDPQRVPALESEHQVSDIPVDVADAPENLMVYTIDQGQYKTKTNLAPQTPDPQRVPALASEHQVSDIPVEIAVLTTELPLLTSTLAGTTLSEVTGVPDVPQQPSASDMILTEQQSSSYQAASATTTDVGATPSEVETQFQTNEESLASGQGNINPSSSNDLGSTLSSPEWYSTHEVPYTSDYVQPNLPESSETLAIVEGDVADAPENLMVPDLERIPPLESEHQVSDISIEIAVLTTELPSLTSILAGSTLSEETGVPDVSHQPSAPDMILTEQQSSAYQAASEITTDVRATPSGVLSQFHENEASLASEQAKPSTSHDLGDILSSQKWYSTHEVPHTSDYVQPDFSGSTETWRVIEGDIGGSKNVTTPDPQIVTPQVNEHKFSDVPEEIAKLPTELSQLSSILAGTTHSEVMGVPDLSNQPSSSDVITTEQQQSSYQTASETTIDVAATPPGVVSLFPANETSLVSKESNLKPNPSNDSGDNFSVPKWSSTFQPSATTASATRVSSWLTTLMPTKPTRVTGGKKPTTKRAKIRHPTRPGQGPYIGVPDIVRNY